MTRTDSKTKQHLLMTLGWYLCPLSNGQHVLISMHCTITFLYNIVHTIHITTNESLASFYFAKFRFLYRMNFFLLHLPIGFVTVNKLFTEMIQFCAKTEFSWKIIFTKLKQLDILSWICAEEIKEMYTRKTIHCCLNITINAIAIVIAQQTNTSDVVKRNPNLCSLKQIGWKGAENVVKFLNATIWEIGRCDNKICYRIFVLMVS